MSNEQWFGHVKRGEPVPMQWVLERRWRGMRTIRQEALVRALRTLGAQGTGFPIEWEDEEAVSSIPWVQDKFRALTLQGSTKVVGRFKDVWIVCFPEDSESAAHVHAKITRMCEALTR